MVDPFGNPMRLLNLPRHYQACWSPFLSAWASPWPKHRSKDVVLYRQGDQGFGEGNFKALFESLDESLECDQLRRGVIKVKD